jgi:predicted  nucleic acid-binding Zn-ribbon protein
LPKYEPKYGSGIITDQLSAIEQRLNSTNNDVINAQRRKMELADQIALMEQKLRSMEDRASLSPNNQLSSRSRYYQPTHASSETPRYLDKPDLKMAKQQSS